MLAVGAVPIIETTKYDVRLCAGFTFIDCHSVMLCAAIDDGIDDFAMFKEHAVPKALDILRAESLKNFFNCHHGHPLSSAR